MHKLTVLNVEQYELFANPVEDGHLSLTSPASDLMVDYAKESPVMVDYRYPAAQALELLHKTSDRLIIVLDSAQHFWGLISTEKLNSQELIKRISSGHKREDLTVADFVNSRDTVKALSIDDLQQANVADVLLALRDNGLQYCLVIDEATQRIRALLSASEIGRKLGLELPVSPSVRFSEIAAVIYRQFHPDPRPLFAVN